MAAGINNAPRIFCNKGPIRNSNAECTPAGFTVKNTKKNIVLNEEDKLNLPVNISKSWKMFNNSDHSMGEALSFT